MNLYNCSTCRCTAMQGSKCPLYIERMSTNRYEAAGRPNPFLSLKNDPVLFANPHSVALLFIDPLHPDTRRKQWPLFEDMDQSTNDLSFKKYVTPRKI